MTKRLAWWSALAGAVAFAACGDDGAVETDGDEQGAVGLPNGKADSGLSDCQADGALLWLNDPAVSADALRAGGVNSRAANQLAAARAGADGVMGTDDDAHFADLEQVDAVPWVGPRSFAQLVGAVSDRCEGLAAYPAVEWVFSPQLLDESHVARAEALIDGAERSIDIAIYSFRLSGLREALGRAVARGVDVRFIFESAGDHRKDPDGTMSAKLEELGVDVRWVNKIMHHKFMIVDGPREALLDGLTAAVLTGSANWSSSAATRYDENTVVLSGAPELALRFQREFNHLWANSRDFVWDASFVARDSIPVAEAAIIDSPWLDTAFTSANFGTKISATYGPTFTTIRGENAVADTLVALIEGAERSIRVASGHLRSRPVSEALLRQLQAKPDLDVRVYLDGQEYISAYTQQKQELELDECLAAATTDVKRQDCLDKGYYFSYELHLAGAEVRFKHYAFRWHYSYAPQMHHKYLLVDDRHLATGSYNLSDNAEHNTFENVVFYDGAQFGSLVAAFVDNFEAMWLTGSADRVYEALIAEIETGTDDVPIVYDAMALTWDEVTHLKGLIRATCVDVDDEDHRRNPQSNYTCSRAAASTHTP